MLYNGSRFTKKLSDIYVVTGTQKVIAGHIVSNISEHITENLK